VNTPRSEEAIYKRGPLFVWNHGSGQSVRLKFKMHFLEDEDEVHESFADNPESLEGRLLFAVPKSE